MLIWCTKRVHACFVRTTNEKKKKIKNEGFENRFGDDEIVNKTEKIF